MRRTAALVLAVPAVLLLLAPGRSSPNAADPPPQDTSDAAAIVTAQASSGAGSTAEAPSVVPPTVDVPSPSDTSAGPAGDRDTTDAAGDGGHADDPVPSGPAAPAAGTAFVVAPVPDEGGVAGSGPLWRYTVEVEPTLDIDPVQLAAEVRAALHDPRSWARDRTLQQVADPSRARIRIALASPSTVDELCGQVGLDTAGIYSCWSGRLALLNAWRWENGADGFADLVTYRTYLVNHEVGHALGFGHSGCPGPGALAPIMMQQSKGLEGCVANGWPHP